MHQATLYNIKCEKNYYEEINAKKNNYFDTYRDAAFAAYQRLNFYGQLIIFY